MAKSGPRLFVGVFPGGIVYADRHVEENNDYKRIAFLPFRELELWVSQPNHPCLKEVKEHAATIQAKRGQPFEISACGQSVILGRLQ